MTNTHGVRLRGLNGRLFYDPLPVLVALREAELAIAASDAPEMLKRLRTGGLKNAREARIAAIFAYGVEKHLGRPIRVSPGEFEDGDFVLQVNLPDRDALMLVQLKELPPADINASLGLDELIAQVGGKPRSDAVLLVHLNRDAHLDLSRLAGYRVPFRELWFAWRSERLPERWTLFGDAMATPRVTEFEYPTEAAVAS